MGYYCGVSPFQSYIKPIVSFQNKAVCIISNTGYHSSRQFKTLGILKFNDMYKLYQGKFVRQLHNTVPPVVLSINCIDNSPFHHHNNRQANQFHINYSVIQIYVFLLLDTRIHCL